MFPVCTSVELAEDTNLSNNSLSVVIYHKIITVSFINMHETGNVFSKSKPYILMFAPWPLFTFCHIWVVLLNSSDIQKWLLYNRCGLCCIPYTWKDLKILPTYTKHNDGYQVLNTLLSTKWTCVVVVFNIISYNLSTHNTARYYWLCFTDGKIECKEIFPAPHS